jgi:hypothetical protein
MADIVELGTERELYEADEHAWIERQIAALRDGDIDRIDRANLIEFLTDMAARDRRELPSRLKVLVQHISKFMFKNEKASRSWRLTALEQQREIRRILGQIPSLAEQADAILREVYPDAVKAAAADTGLDAKEFFGLPPLGLEAALNFDDTRVGIASLEGTQFDLMG